MIPEVLSHVTILLRLVTSVAPENIKPTEENVEKALRCLIRTWIRHEISKRDGKLKGLKKQSVRHYAENTFNGAELCQNQIMASISHFDFTANVDSREDNFEGFFEESSGWATISNWLERQTEILSKSIRLQRSTFDHISSKIRHFSLQATPPNSITLQRHSEMDFKLNGNIFEPEPIKILPNEFVILHLSHFWKKTFRCQNVIFCKTSFLYSLLGLMIKGLI